MRKPLPRRTALLLVILVPVLWSMAGILTRHLSPISGYEVVFWRSFFVALFVGVFLSIQKRGELLATFGSIGWLGLLSGLMWGIIFSCFMLALTMTTVANTVIMDSITPLLTAFLAWIFLKQKILLRTWIAIIFALAGMIWMFTGSVSSMGGTDFVGMLFALMVPVGYAINFVIFGRKRQEENMIPTILIGGVLSALVMLPLSWPFHVSAQDMVILATLGTFQLGLPCILLIYVSQSLPPAEIALITLLEVLLGPLWVWIGVGETPSRYTIVGGAIIMLCLVLHEVVPMLQSK